MKGRLSGLALLLLPLTGCALQGPLREEAPWTPMGEQQWRVATRDLSFSLKVDGKRNFTTAFGGGVHQDTSTGNTQFPDTGGGRR